MGFSFVKRLDEAIDTHQRIRMDLNRNAAEEVNRRIAEGSLRPEDGDAEFVRLTGYNTYYLDQMRECLN